MRRLYWSIILCQIKFAGTARTRRKSSQISKLPHHFQAVNSGLLNRRAFAWELLGLTNRNVLLLHPDFRQKMQEHISQQTSYSKAKQDSQASGTTCKHSNRECDNWWTPQRPFYFNFQFTRMCNRYMILQLTWFSTEELIGIRVIWHR